ncbi:MAG: epoxide hydrolase N-terminal domain-containing protein, partial [Kiloniellales bacterium]
MSYGMSAFGVIGQNRRRQILDSQAYWHHDMTSIQSFHIDIPDETLDRIRARVAGYPWHEMPDDGGWEYGTNLDYMKELCAYWVEEFDWRKQEAAINRFSHFIAP